MEGGFLRDRVCRGLETDLLLGAPGTLPVAVLGVGALPPHQPGTGKIQPLRPGPKKRRVHVNNVGLDLGVHLCYTVPTERSVEKVKPWATT